jgi:epoxyqueuosine reductase
VPTTVLPAPTAEPSAAEPTLETLLKAQAYGLGFDLVGIARLGPVASASAFEEWVAAGYAGEMAWLARGAEKRRDTRLSVPASLARTDERAPAVSAVVVAMDYGGREPEGPVARYARGQDYHAVLEERLRALHRWLEVRLGRAVPGKPYVDTGPLLERDLARRAGLGWFGKNTNLIHPTRGSFHFLGTLLVGLELAPDAPFEADRCGTCTRCLDAVRVVSDDRAAGRDRRGAAGGRRRPAVWLRRVSGRLSLESAVRGFTSGGVAIRGA